ncbi:hypothetical protein AAZX31_02G249700 [Glycine max]|nr:hypothetical protein JHK87_005334 [Glycine soja]
MGLKTKITLLIIPLAMLLFVSSEVSARDFQEGKVVQEANNGGDAKLFGGGSFFPGGGIGGGAGYFPGGGIGGGGGGGFFPGGGIGGGGFLPGRGFFNPRFCFRGCCFGNPFRGCLRCCPIF